MYHSFSRIDWSFLNFVEDPNLAVGLFYDAIYQVLNDCCPKKSIKKCNYPVWYSRELIYFIKTKEKFRWKFKRNGKDTDLTEFQRMRRLVKIRIKADYSEYLRNVENNINIDVKKFWDFVKNTKTHSNASMDMHDGNNVFKGEDQAVEAFARHFKSTYAPSSLSNTVNDPGTDLPSRTLIINEITEEDVTKAIKQLKSKRSAGPDKIPSFVFKGCCETFIKPLCNIFNLCLNKSVFPEYFKLTRVTPIFKNGDPKLIQNYRPVAILSVPAKIFEILICKKIMSFIKPILSEKQHGFQPKKSILTNMMNFTEFASTALDQNCQIDVIFTDYTKAFDRVDHSLLLYKMHKLGFSAELVNFFHSYFSKRSQYVSYKGYNSNSYLAESGVPQGSNLGPCLFNLFINDIVNCVKYSNILMYADDLKLFKIINSRTDSYELQKDLDAVAVWSVNNKIFFNINKCKVMTLTRKKNPLVNNYTINNEPLERLYEFKDLGILLDPALNFNQHITVIVNKAY